MTSYWGGMIVSDEDFGPFSAHSIFSTLKHGVASLPRRRNLYRKWSFMLVAHSSVKCLGLHLYLELEKKTIINSYRVEENLWGKNLVKLFVKKMWLLFCVHIRIFGFVKDSGMHAWIHTCSQKLKTRPSHHDECLCAIIWTSFALKWMDEVNDHYLGEPPHLVNYMRVNM